MGALPAADSSPLHAAVRQTSVTAAIRKSWRVELFAILLPRRIPVLVQRPAPATQTRRPSPLMPAAGTPPASVKRVPYRAAAAEEIFRVRAIVAHPRTPSVRPPPAQRAANTALARL